jgi:ABC-type antimicrobial peptide transport system permease subunit
LLAFCVLTYMNASMKTARSRREFAVERQMGASDRDIYKKMRVMTYPSAVISVGLTVAVVLGFCTFHILTAMAELNIQADMFPLTYTPEFYAKCREEIFGLVAYILPILAAALPMQIVTALTAVLGTIIPTRRLLKEPVTEGLRKDTD